MPDEGKTMIYYHRGFIRLASDFRLPRTVGETVVIGGVRYRISNVVNTSTAFGDAAQSCHLEEDSSPLPANPGRSWPRISTIPRSEVSPSATGSG